ncbi:MAG TPA: LysR substrate-binding domain-containing protein, partial [Burkholderiaceae bacterium]
GCRSRRLGVLRYCATASPAFAARWFASGVDADSLERAPSLRFDRSDRLQDQWVRRLVRRDVALPVHRMPSSQAFVDAALAGIGWGMNPVALVGGHLKAKRLVELVPDRPLDVPLYWQVARLPLPVLDALTRCVVRAAGVALRT